jgi:hypothetical protein
MRKRAARRRPAVDWYDKNCAKRAYTARQSFTESAEPHNVLNSGLTNAQGDDRALTRECGEHPA